MEAQTFIFIGRSGSGKGTQVNMLEKVLKERDPGKSVFRLETGAKFREFILGNTHSQQLARAVYQDGKLQPEFLTVFVWARILIENLGGGEHIIIDGTPRKINEASVLDSAMNFYDRKNPHVIYIDVSRQWAFDRLLARGRFDDKEDDVNKRLNWFETDVLPTVAYYRNNPDYKFIAVNGEQSVEKVHQDLIAQIFP